MDEYIKVRDRLIQLEDKGKQDTEEYKELEKKWRKLREEKK